jgi:beta-fructofuranosidase
MLHLDDHWIWDFWIVDDGPDHHLFFLKAPRSLGDPDLRHHHAVVGHAVSSDLVGWRLLPDALAPGPRGAWDDGAPWTGSVIHHDGRWYLLYTSTSTADGGTVQRIGAAVSDDLVRWARHEHNPVLTADRRLYESYGDGDWFDEAWRDPWLLADPSGDGVLAYICARVRAGSSDERGAIGLARTADLVNWTVHPALYAPGEFAQMEVPQMVNVGSRWYLLFCTPDWSHSRCWIERTGRAPATTTHYVMATSPTGPFTTMPEPLTPEAESGVLYAGKLHATGERLIFLATQLHDADGNFAGDLTDPRPVTIEHDGRLVVGD